MNRAAYRFNDALVCWKHIPFGQEIVADEHMVVKRESLIGQGCTVCGIPFITEDPPKPQRDKFRDTWAREVEKGKALPSAGDLFEEES